MNRITPESVTRADIEAQIAALYKAFTGNPELLDGVVTADWQDIPLGPGQAPGRDGAKPLIRALQQAFSDLTITVCDLLVDGNRVGVRAVMTGRHTGEWLGVAPTHKPFSLALHEFHLFEDARITHTWHLEDWFGWLNQVNV